MDPAKLKRYEERLNRYKSFIKEYTAYELYEDAFSYLVNHLSENESISYYLNNKYLLNNKLKIALYLKTLRTSGSYQNKLCFNDEDHKRPHKIVWKRKDIVTTSKSLQREIYEFFRFKKDYTLIVICGTDKHEQAVFLRKKKSTHEALIFDPDLQNRKKSLPVSSFLAVLNLSNDNKVKLIYDCASHRLTNVKDFCAAYVGLEVRNCMVDGRNPFNRVNLPRYPATN